MREINEEKFQIHYDSAQALVSLRGALLLNGASAYEPILTILKEAAEEQNPNALVVDISGLTFLNSSGINMMTKFVMFVSDIKSLELSVTIRAQKQVAWQERLVINLKRLMPDLHADIH